MPIVSSKMYSLGYVRRERGSIASVCPTVCLSLLHISYVSDLLLIQREAYWRSKVCVHPCVDPDPDPDKILDSLLAGRIEGLK